MPDTTEQSKNSERRANIAAFLTLSRQVNTQIVDFFRTEYNRELQVGDNAVVEFAKIKPTILHGTPAYYDVANILLQMDKAIRILTKVPGEYMELVNDETMISLYRVGLEFAKRYNN